MTDRLDELKQIRDDLATFGVDDEEYQLYVWMISRIEALEGWMHRLEWSMYCPYGSARWLCPECRNAKEEGHAADCRLAAAIGKGAVGNGGVG